MKKSLTLLPLLALSAWVALQAADKPAVQEPASPLKILLIAGGCCHDYAMQKDVLKAGIESRLRAEVDVVYNPDTSTKATFEPYQADDWAQGYDVILHDECSADVTDKAYVNRIVEAHRQGVPAVNLHCAMHSYRWGQYREPVEAGAENAGWYEMLGVQSTGHGPKEPIDISFIDPEHPITVGMKDWTTIDEELYNNIQVFPTAKALATGKQMVKTREGERQDTAVVAWTNEFGPRKTKIFSTTLGHFTETVADDRYLDLVTRGLLWVTGHLTDEGKPAEGYGAGE